MSTRQLPAQVEAEQSVLAACLADSSGTAVAKALELLQVEHFSSPSARMIFEVVRALYDSSQPVDALLVIRELQRRHQLGQLVAADYQGFTKLDKQQRLELREAAGRDAVLALARELPVVARIPHHARLIREAWGKRQVITLFTKPMQEAWNGGPPDEVIRQVENACQALRGLVEDEGASKVVPALEAAQRAQERVQRGVSRQGAVPAPYLFLRDLMPGRLYVLGGYAKDGKTVVGVQALRRACEAKIRTGFVSIEMAEAYLTDRMLATFSIPYGPLQDGKVAEMSKPEWQYAVACVSSWPMEILDDPACEISDIIRFQKLGHFQFLIIDHLHQISYEQAREPRLRLSANVKALAQLARTAKIPILLLAQLHRPPASDGFPRPTMQSFKETGTIEQVASALWAIYRKRNAETGERSESSQFFVLADRFGSDSVHPLHFMGKYQRFDSIEWRREP